MLGLYPLRQKPRPPSSTTLYKEIERWVTAVQDVAATLPAPGHHAATGELFDYHREGLTELALLLIDYTRQHRHPYYSILHRSKGALDAAEATIIRARQCAKLFDAYSRTPKKYNRVDATIELRYLLAQLTNLLGWLQA